MWHICKVIFCSMISNRKSLEIMHNVQSIRWVIHLREYYATLRNIQLPLIKIWKDIQDFYNFFKNKDQSTAYNILLLEYKFGGISIYIYICSHKLKETGWTQKLRKVVFVGQRLTDRDCMPFYTYCFFVFCFSS